MVQRNNDVKGALIMSRCPAANNEDRPCKPTAVLTPYPGRYYWRKRCPNALSWPILLAQTLPTLGNEASLRRLSLVHYNRVLPCTAGSVISGEQEACLGVRFEGWL